jgi:hypothetical protein
MTTIPNEQMFDFQSESECFDKMYELEKTFTYDSCKVDGVGYLTRYRYFLEGQLVSAIGIFSFSAQSKFQVRFFLA